MAEGIRRIGIGGILLLIVVGLMGFLYASYTGFFEPMFVSAVATAALVLVTTVSVILTLSLLDEERRSREQEIMPTFKINLQGISLSTMGIALKNIGNGPGQNIEANIRIEPQGYEQEITYPNVASGDFVPVGDPFEEISLKPKKFDNYDKLIVEGTCEDIVGNDHDFRDEEALEFPKGNGVLMRTKSTEQHLDDISNELSDVVRELKDIEGNM